MAKLESEFQSCVIKRLQAMFPESYIYANNGSRIQGFPDITILHDSGRWATLECKRSRNERFQPNQKYYVDDLNSKSFSAIVYPENEEEIMDAIQRSFVNSR